MLQAIRMILFVGVCFFSTGLVKAQYPEAKRSLVSEYLADPVAQRSSIWWDALGRELALAIDVPHTAADDDVIKYIIFFATNHHEKVMLNDAADRLLDIYNNHPDEGLRMMSVAALYAIGDTESMKDLQVHVAGDASRRVRHIASAAVYSFNAEH
ncbi:MAG: hypothetical protein HKN43_14885 [Rhodothermales bacterium]|nr:hypothetical protein [Rhodothermales bacterium]